MGFKQVFLFFSALLFTTASFAQGADGYTQSRILILLDGSSSMTQKWAGGKLKHKVADDIIMALMDSVYAVNKDVEFSLRVFGHQYTVEQNNCTDTRNEVPFAKDNRTQMQFRLSDIQPLGITPIAYSLKQAAEKDIVDIARNTYSIVLITDGGESCGGDICDVMKKLIASKVFIKPYIVSLEDYAPLRATYACMGDYLQVTKDSDVPKAVGTIVKAFTPALKITLTDYRELQKIAAKVPSILKVDVPEISLPPATDSNLVSKAPTRPTPIIIPRLAPKAVHTLVVKPFNPTQASNRRVPALPPLVIEIPPRLPDMLAKVPLAPRKVLPSGTLAPATLLSTLLAPLPPLVIEYPPRVADALLRLPNGKTRLLTAASVTANSPANAAIFPLPALVIDIPPPPRDKEVITRLSPAKPRAITMLTALPAALRPVSQPTLPTFEILIPIETFKTEKLPLSAIARTRLLRITPPVPAAPTARSIAPLPALSIDVPPPLPTPVAITRLSASPTIALRVKAPTPTDARRLTRIPKLPPMVAELPAPPPADKINKLGIAQLQPFRMIFIIEERPLAPRKVPALPPLKIDIPKIVVNNVPKPINTLPAKPTAAVERKVEATMMSEDASETSLEVYFTNGRGKFFTTTPQVFLVDQATKKIAKKFFRTVDGSGLPDPQTGIPPGTYDLSLPARASLMVRNIVIEPNKRKKVFVTVGNSSISFTYMEPTNSDKYSNRPITEFTAVVIERNKAKGRVQNQKCTEALEYEPGNYHIEINTFPKTIRNVDIDFDEAVIAIPQPGFAKFTPVGGTGTTVQLYQTLGDKFVPFHVLDLNNPTSQHLQIQPGEYQAHYQRGPGNSYATIKVYSFTIKATQETEILLN